ncbi:unnamed protein product [Linum tenue]|uniref:Uncharacterized protein n=1 Tax=Linum tenue TaxID=586396 RepID=A0AAV0KWB8_9ROSI|nr:unnamed protein product [Linum tenue]
MNQLEGRSPWLFWSVSRKISCPNMVAGRLQLLLPIA